MDFRKEAEKYKEDIIKDIKALVSIKSITNAPETKKALDWILDWCKKDGGQIARTEQKGTKFAGHAHYGNDEDFIGILGHMDVVPAIESNWEFSPWDAKVDGNYLTGRGTQDDKAPTLMALYAHRMIKDLNIKLDKGVRFIFGTQEEGGDWSDIKHYFSIHPYPQLGFTPDSEFPLIFAEKGILRLVLSAKLPNAEGLTITGGTVVNAIPSVAKVIYKSELTEFKGTSDHAKDAHISRDNAIWKAFDYISQKVNDPVLQWIDKYLVNDPLLEKVGIGYSTDEEGPLTCNMGIININENGMLELKLDIRWPQGSSHDEIRLKLAHAIEEAGIEMSVTVASQTDPLYIPKTHKLIKTLEAAYRKYAHEDEKNEPLRTTGGGTYAKVMPNCVAFGPLFPSDERLLHKNNERLNIDKMFDAIAVYAEAIVNLCNK